MTCSQNYAWDGKKFLGQGSYGIVYLGHRRCSGEEVAVKVYFPNKRSPEKRWREVEVLRRVNHQNIVRILAFETVVGDPKVDVLVMELCRGGNFTSFLTQPQNKLGLEDEELLRFIGHVSAAIKYLWERKIAHRDIKSDNVLRFVTDDGRSVYKLADFDAAKDVADEDTLCVGTVICLHPHVILQINSSIGSTDAKRKYSESIELWSIGVMIYNAATGNFPFNYSSKPPGLIATALIKKNNRVIAAHYSPSEGKIVMEESLPETCLLSPFLKDEIYNLLTQLFDLEDISKPNFSQYFDTVETISSKRRVEVVNLNKMGRIRLYLQEDCTDPMNAIKTEIGNTLRDWKVDSANQILLYDGVIVEDGTGPDLGSSLPQTSQKNPIFLCDLANPPQPNENLFQGFLKDISGKGGGVDGSISMRNRKETRFLRTRENFENVPCREGNKSDSSVANYNNFIAHNMTRMTEEIIGFTKLIQLAVSGIHQAVTKQLKEVSKDAEQIQQGLLSLDQRLGMLEDLKNVCLKSETLIPVNCKQYKRRLERTITKIETLYADKLLGFNTFKKEFEEFKPAVEFLMGLVDGENNLLKKWELAQKDQKDFILKERKHIGKASESYLRKVKKNGNYITKYSGNNDQNPDQFLLARMQMIENVNNLETLLDKCITTFRPLSISFSEWLQHAHVALSRSRVLSNELTNLKVTLAKSESDFQISYLKYREKLGKFASEISEVSAAQTETEMKILEQLSKMDGDIKGLQNNFGGTEDSYFELGTKIIQIKNMLKE